MKKLAKKKGFKESAINTVTRMAGDLLDAKDQVLQRLLDFRDRCMGAVDTIVERVEGGVVGTIEGVNERLQTLVFSVTIVPISHVSQRLRAFLTDTVVRVAMFPQKLLTQYVFDNIRLLGGTVAAEMRSVRDLVSSAPWHGSPPPPIGCLAAGVAKGRRGGQGGP